MAESHLVANSRFPGELRRELVELRDLSEKAERSLAEFRKAIDRPDRFGIGGNNPPQEIRNTVIQGILAAQVVRDEVEADEPKWPALRLALSTLQGTVQNVRGWIGQTCADANAAAMAAADTEIGRALVAAVAAEELIKVLVRLFELVGKSF